jgi:hypothetical protein
LASYNGRKGEGECAPDVAANQILRSEGGGRSFDSVNRTPVWHQNQSRVALGVAPPSASLHACMLACSEGEGKARRGRRKQTGGVHRCDGAIYDHCVEARTTVLSGYRRHCSLPPPTHQHSISPSIFGLAFFLPLLLIHLVLPTTWLPPTHLSLGSLGIAASHPYT